MVDGEGGKCALRRCCGDLEQECRLGGSVGSQAGSRRQHWNNLSFISASETAFTKVGEAPLMKEPASYARNRSIYRGSSGMQVMLISRVLFSHTPASHKHATLMEPLTLPDSIAILPSNGKIRSQRRASTISLPPLPIIKPLAEAETRALVLPRSF